MGLNKNSKNHGFWQLMPIRYQITTKLY